MLYKTYYYPHKDILMDTSQTLFLMHITDGYSFRNTIGIIKSETDHATMIISPTSIEISFMNRSKCAVHKIVLQTQEFAMYLYNIRNSDGTIVSEYPIAFETNEMFNTTKSIGRKDGIRIYWMAGDNKLNIQPIKMSTKDPGRAGASFVRIHNIECVRYDTGSHNVDPNVRVSAKDFADLCSQSCASKCTSMDIVGQNSSVTFKGVLANNTIAFIQRFASQIEIPKMTKGLPDMQAIDNLLENLRITENKPTSSAVSLNVIKSEDLMTIRVPISTVKALSKIHNISAPGTLLRFYFGEGKPTKIGSPIGTYGTYTICIRNPRC